MPRPSSKSLWIAGAAACLAAAALVFYAVTGFFDTDPLEYFGVGGGRPRYVGVLFSGDLGLRVGMSPHIAAELGRKGVPVLGISSSTEFATHKSRAEVDALLAKSVTAALARTHARQAILIGQSFGADMVRVGMAHLPAALRSRVAGAVLVVPGRDAFFRADPTSLSYRGTPDVGPAEASQIGWTWIVCIRGFEESDSLCPTLSGGNVRKIVLPGGHLLHRDHALLTSTIVSALEPLLGDKAR